MRSRPVVLALCALAALALAAPAAAFAHVPVLEPARASVEPLEIPPPVVSRAVYGYLGRDENVDSYTFTMPKTTDTSVGIIVPVRGALADFQPDVTILGPDGAPVLELPGGPPDRPRFFEPFSLEWFYQGPERTVTLGAGRRYVLEVGHGEGAVRYGDYVVTFGGPESFTPLDGLRATWDVPRIWLGLYGGGPLRPVPVAILLAGVGVVLGFIVAELVARRRRRGAEDDQDQPAR